MTDAVENVETGTRTGASQTTTRDLSRVRRLTVRFHPDTHSTRPRTEPLASPPPWAPIDPATLDTSPWLLRVRAYLERSDQARAAAQEEPSALSRFDFYMLGCCMFCCTCCCSRHVLVSSSRREHMAENSYRHDNRSARETRAQEIDDAWDNCLCGLWHYPRWWCAYMCCACDNEDDQRVGASMFASCVRRVVQPLVLLVVCGVIVGVVYVLITTAAVIPMALV